jgi:peroxin-3
VENKIANQAYRTYPVTSSTARVQELSNPEEAKAKLASTLAVFCKQAHSIGSGGTFDLGGVGSTGVGSAGGGNEYLAAMENVRDLEAFAAVVYSSNFEFEEPDVAELGEAGAIEGPTRAIGGDTITLDLEAEKEAGGQTGFEQAWSNAVKTVEKA